MSLPPGYAIERLSPQHDRSDFDCGQEALNRYLREQASQDLRRRLSVTFVLLDRVSNNRLAGFYTLATSAAKLEALPPQVSKRLPKYPLVSAIVLARLAIAQKEQGKGLGAALLFDALRRCLQQEIPAFVVIVDAKDEQAKAFYEHYGFTPFVRQPNRLFLPMATIALLFR